MRDYLKLFEVEKILYQHLEANYIKDIMRSMEAEANTCLCHAHNSSECMCGAWECDE